MNMTGEKTQERPITVLLVDDQIMIGEALRRMLAPEHDIIFHFCMNPDQGIPVAVTVSPTVILQDLHMPDIDGLTMVKYFRRDPATANIPLIVLSSEDDAKVKAEAFANGANDYLVKLPDRIELIARIRYHSRAYINLLERNEAFATIMKNQSELLEAHNTLDTILSKVPIGIVIVNLDYQVLWVNRPAINMLHVQDQQNIIGKDFRTHVASPKYDLNNVESCDLFNVERQFRTADNQIVPVMESILKTSMNGTQVIIFAFMDISEQKRAEQANRMIQGKLQQAQKLESVGKLAAGIAHEINTPLQFIHDNLLFINHALPSINQVLDMATTVAATSTTHSEAMAAKTLQLKELLSQADIEFVKTETTAAIKQSLEGTERMAKIVLAMKEFANNSGGKINHHDLNKMIENTITVSANQWRQVATMELDLIPGQLDVMCCNEEINQVLLNIIVNAVQAIELVQPGTQATVQGTIKISSQKQDKYAIVEISDNGPGIPEQIKNRIFEPFFTTREVGQGVGQGLTIAYDLVVNKHKGELTFTSKAGCGTTFTIKLPLVHEL